MTVNDALRLIAGGMLILSVVLTQLVHPNWFYFTLFIALNLVQSAFTKWCPMMTILRKFGAKD